MIGHCQTDLADSQKIVFVFSSARMILTSSYCFVCIQNTHSHTHLLYLLGYKNG